MKNIRLKSLLSEQVLTEGYSLSYGNDMIWTDEEWSKLLKVVRDALKLAKKHDIVIRDGHGNGAPIINNDEIYLNGDGANDLDHETFVINKDGSGSSRAYTKTNRKPYDAIVATILFHAKKIKKELKPNGDDNAKSIRVGGTEGWENQYYSY